LSSSDYDAPFFIDMICNSDRQQQEEERDRCSNNSSHPAILLTFAAVSWSSRSREIPTFFMKAYMSMPDKPSIDCGRSIEKPTRTSYDEGEDVVIDSPGG
jgi:hypothetical protein